MTGALVGVVGPRGFIGAAFVRAFQSAGATVVPIERDTELAHVPPLDLAAFCAGNSAAHLTRKDPLRCLELNVADLHRVLTQLKVRRWIAASSLAVYPNELVNKDEAAPLDPRALSLYGAHKLLAERYVQEFAPDHVLLRIGYLFGRGLKKNLFFDLRTRAPKIYLDPRSVLAPIDVDRVASAGLALAAAAPTGVYNVAGSTTFSVQDLVAIAPGPVTVVTERFIDDRGVSLQRLNEFWKAPSDAARDRGDLMAFLAA